MQGRSEAPSSAQCPQKQPRPTWPHPAAPVLGDSSSSLVSVLPRGPSGLAALGLSPSSVLPSTQPPEGILPMPSALQATALCPLAHLFLCPELLLLWPWGYMC